MTPQLRRANESDVAFLADVVLLSSEDRYRRHADWDLDAFHAGLIEDAADQVGGGVENSVTYVIVVDGIDVGRARLITTTNRIEIAGLQVLPEHQNQGIGTAVISQVVNTAAAAGIPVILDVESDNPDARRLYERLGFRPNGAAIKDRQPMILHTDPPTTAWNSPEQRAATETWARDSLANLGRTATGPMTDVSIQAWSAVRRIPTNSGDAIVKQTTPDRRREGDIVAFCSDRAPQQVDAPLMVDVTNGRMLLIDRGPTLYDADQDTRGLDLDTVMALVTDYARLQQATIGHDQQAAAAGIPSWDPDSAADVAERQAAKLHQLPESDPCHITNDQRERIHACLPDIKDAGRQIAGSNVPYCLDHGDLWPGNVIPAEASDRFRYIDFGDAAWTHPFLSMSMMVVECRYHWSVPDRADGLNLEHPVLQQILNTYLSAWTGYAPLAELRETLRHALRIAPLRRSSAWMINLAGADEQSRTEEGKMAWAWLEDVTLPVLL